MEIPGWRTEVNLSETKRAVCVCPEASEKVKASGTFMTLNMTSGAFDSDENNH